MHTLCSSFTTINVTWPSLAVIKQQTMSHHCHDEHSHIHGHGHGHDHDHDHDHDHSDDVTPALQNHIYAQIDFDAIDTLNESRPGAGRDICKKTHDRRLDVEPELCSDADEQLLMHIPYVHVCRCVELD